MAPLPVKCTIRGLRLNSQQASRDRKGTPERRMGTPVAVFPECAAHYKRGASRATPGAESEAERREPKLIQAC